MQPSKLVSAALFVTIFGVVLIVPPLALVSSTGFHIFGMPTELIYLFAVWAGLVVAAAVFAQRLPRDRTDDSREGVE